MDTEPSSQNEEINEALIKKGVSQKALQKACENALEVHNHPPVNYLKTTKKQRDALRIESSFATETPLKITPCSVDHEQLKKDLSFLQGQQRQVSVELPIDNPSFERGVRKLTLDADQVRFCLFCGFKFI